MFNVFRPLWSGPLLSEDDCRQQISVAIYVTFAGTSCWFGYPLEAHASLYLRREYRDNVERTQRCFFPCPVPETSRKQRGYSRDGL